MRERDEREREGGGEIREGGKEGGRERVSSYQVPSNCKRMFSTSH